MKIAFLFPGQGAQFVGMGKDLYETNPRARQVFDEADKTLRFSLSRLCFQGIKRPWIKRAAMKGTMLCVIAQTKPAAATTAPPMRMIGRMG